MAQASRSPTSPNFALQLHKVQFEFEWQLSSASACWGREDIVRLKCLVWLKVRYQATYLCICTYVTFACPNVHMEYCSEHSRMRFLIRYSVRPLERLPCSDRWISVSQFKPSFLWSSRQGLSSSDALMFSSHRSVRKEESFRIICLFVCSFSRVSGSGESNNGIHGSQLSQSDSAPPSFSFSNDLGSQSSIITTLQL